MKRHTQARTIALLGFSLAMIACSESHQTEEDASIPLDGFFGLHDAPSVLHPDAPPAAPDAALACDVPFAIARACSADTECALVLHRADCCGTGAWVGVSESGRVAFEDYVETCEPTQPLCDCIAGPTRADDGTDETLAGALLRVACVDGACTSSYR